MVEAGFQAIQSGNNATRWQSKLRIDLSKGDDSPDKLDVLEMVGRPRPRPRHATPPRKTLIPILLLLILCCCDTSHAWMLSSLSLPRRRVDSSSSSNAREDNHPRPRQLPPGRPVGFLKSLFFDDTFKLLNPKTIASYQLDRKQEFGPIFRTNIFFRPTVCVVDEARVQQLAAMESSMQAFFPPHIQKLFGKNSIILISGPAHKRVRMLVAQSLAPQAVQGFEPLIQSAMDDFLDGLTTTTTTSKTKNSNSSDDYVVLVPKLCKFFISVTLQVVLGTSTAPAEDLASDLEQWSQGLLATPLTLVPWSTAAKALRARKRIAKRFADILKTKPTTGLLGLLLQAKEESGNTLSDDDIIDNILTIVFAGSDTTASAAISVLKALHLNPELRESLSDENDTLEAFIGSILQSYPPAPFSMRLTQEELSLGDDYSIPANWLVLYGLAGTLLSSPAAPTTTTGTPSSLAASLAFGAGARKCPGRFLAILELKVWLRSLMRRQWELEPNQDLEQRYRPGFFPNDDMKVKFMS